MCFHCYSFDICEWRVDRVMN